MIYTKKESLEDRIVRYLVLNNQTIQGIINQLTQERVKATNQGIYKSLRFLTQEEVVIKHKDYFSLNEEWKGKIIQDFQNNQGFELSEHEEIQFSLGSLIHLDQQWKNITLNLQRNFTHYPIFFYNPHDIWSLLSDSRKKSEQSYYDILTQKKVYTFCVNGGNTEFDKITKKEREGLYHKINLGDTIFKETDYITIIGDYIAIVKINLKTAQLIEKCYRHSQNYHSFQREIQNLGVEKKKVKLIIERNTEKAKKLRKRLAKDFYVPQELRGRFNLF